MRHKKLKVRHILRFIHKSIKRQYKSIARSKQVKAVKRLAKMKVSKAAKLAYKFSKEQVVTRPRLRLVGAVLAILVTVFLATNHAVSYLEPKKEKIKINGQPILVANRGEDEAKTPVIEISQSTYAKRSPFDAHKPVEGGYLSQGYRTYHRANDIATSLGSPIHPLGSGIVEFAGSVTNGKGNMVVINHGDGLKSLYAHMGKITVGVGDKVNTDMTLGTVGLTGRTTGPHVHLEIYDNDVAINPASILPE